MHAAAVEIREGRGREQSAHADLRDLIKNISNTACVLPFCRSLDPKLNVSHDF